MRAWLGLPLLLVACGPAEPFAPLPSAQTTVLLHRGSATSAYAYQIWSDSDPVRLKTTDQDIYALLYDRPAAELGLEVGQTPPCLVLRPSQSLRLLVQDASARWSEVDAPSDELFEAFAPGLARRCDPCLPLKESRQMLPSNGRVEGVAWLDSGRLLIKAGWDPTIPLFALAKSGDPIALSGCELYVRDLAALGNNRFLAGGPGGTVELVIDESSSSCQVIRTATATDLHPDDGRIPEIEVLSVGPSPADPIYALSDDGGVFEYRDGTIVLLEVLDLHPYDLVHPFGPDEKPAQYTEYPRLARLGPRELLVSMGWDKIYHWVDDRIDRVDRVDLPDTGFDLNGSDRISAIADVGDGGLFAASVNADFFSWSSSASSWSYELTAPAMDVVGAIAKFRDGFAATVEGGRLVRRHPETGLCPVPFEVTGALGSDGRLLLVDGDEIIVADFFGDSRTPGGILRLSPAP